MKLCVFCGSRSGELPEFRKSAVELGQYLATNGHVLVYGGGSTGIMGSIADSVLDGGGQVIGVIPEHLATSELMHTDVTDMRITRDMHERKALMHSLADAYVALPGGYGTLEELFEAVTWAQLALHSRPVAVLNTAGLYDGLVHLLNSMTQQGFISRSCRNHMTVVSSVDSLLAWVEMCAGSLRST